MNNLIKLSFLVFLQTLIATIKLNITRWIIKNWFTVGELPLGKWYSWEFISNLNSYRIFGLMVIASFTLITFPLGIWIGSFKLGVSYPIINIIGASMQFIMFPLNIFIMNKILTEMVINKTTLIGIVIIEISKILTGVGCWFLYLGNEGL